MAKVDPEWARLEAKAKAKGEKETQDEKDVETIIENFKDKGMWVSDYCSSLNSIPRLALP